MRGIWVIGKCSISEEYYFVVVAVAELGETSPQLSEARYMKATSIDRKKGFACHVLDRAHRVRPGGSWVRGSAHESWVSGGVTLSLIMKKISLNNHLNPPWIKIVIAYKVDKRQ